MIFVIGGAYQGKLKQVLNWLGEENEKAAVCADGASDPFTDIERKPVVYGVQAYLLRLLKTQEDPQSFVERLLEINPEYIIMDEVGYGIVPVTPELRAYRELVGNTGQKLAAKADAVYRMVCGIPVRIK